jgi:hypothetical protein
MRILQNRWWVWATVLFLPLVILAGYLLIPVSPDRISQANCDKIQLGWTWVQVEELLGQSGSGYISTGRMTMEWHDEDGNRIRVDLRCVLLDLDNLKVTQKTYTPTDLSLSERLKRRVERRIRAIWP